MTLAELKSKRSEAYKVLTDLKAKDTDDYQWTSEDQKRWDDANAAYDRLGREIQLDSVGRDTTGIGLDDRRGGSGNAGGDDDYRGQNQDLEYYTDSATGDRVPVFRSGDSMADYARGRSSMERTNVEPGEVLRALAVGAQTEGERRALSEGTDSAGGYTVPEVLSTQMIDSLRKKSRVFQLGAGSIPLDSNKHTFAKLVSDPSPAWRAELDSVGTGDPTFGSIEFAPKSLAVLVRVSEELLQDSVNIGASLNRSLAEALALEVDRVALLGSGSSNEPTGLENMSSVQSISLGTNGAAIADYTPLLDAIEDLQEANAGDVSGAVMAPRTLRVFNGLTDSTGQPLRRPSSIESMPMLQSTQVPIDQTQGTATNASSIYLGDFSNLIVGFRQRLKIEVLKERYRDNLEVGFLAHMRLDVQAWHEQSLAKIVGVIPT